MSDKTSKTEKEIIREYLPFAFYTAVPIAIAITIALIFGTR
jgi:hypothetical protein